MTLFHFFQGFLGDRRRLGRKGPIEVKEARGELAVRPRYRVVVPETDIEAVEHQIHALTKVNVPSVMLASTVAGVPITEQTALRITDVFAAVRLIAEVAATLPLKVYRRGSRGRSEYRGGVADLLDRPAPATTQANLVAQTIGCLALRGNAFLGKFRPGGRGEVEQFHVLPNDRLSGLCRARTLEGRRRYPSDRPTASSAPPSP